jgi:hypothetical protein
MADVNVSLGVTGKEVVVGAFQDVAGSAKAMGDALMEHTKKLIALAAGFEGVKIACDQFKKVFEEGGQLNDLSEQTGIAVEKLVLLQRAFQNNGMEAEDVGKVVNKMQKAISDAGETGSEAADKLHKLGLFSVDLKAMNPEEQLAAFAKAINEIKDPADRSAAAMDIFGKAGGKMLALFSNMPEEIKGAAEEVGTYASIMGNKAAEFDKIGDKLQNAIGHKVIEFFAGALSNLSGGISGLLDAVAKFDAAAFGEKLTHGLSEPMQALATAITTGQFMTALELAYELVKLQAMKMGNELFYAFEAAVAAVQELFTKVFDSEGYIFSYIATGFRVVGSMIKGILIEGILGVLDGIPGFSKVTENLKYQLETTQREIKSGQNALATGWETAQDELGKIVSSSADVAVNVYNSSKNLFDQNAQFQKVAQISKEIQSAWQHSADAVDQFVDRLSNPTPFGQWKMGANGALEAVQAPKTPMQEWQDSWKGNGAGPIEDGRGGSTNKVTVSAPSAPSIPSSFLGSNPYDQSVKLSQAGGNYLNYLSAKQSQAAYNSARQEELNYKAGQVRASQDYTGNSQTSFADLFAQVQEKYRNMGYNRADSADLTDKELKDYIQKNPGPSAKDGGGEAGGGAAGPQKSPEATLMDKIYALLEKHVPKIDDKLPLMALS